MSAVGVKIDQFDDPVCKSFQAKIFNDQLCYEVDLNNVSNKNNIENELKLGFSFIIDYNEDRQVISHLYDFNKTSRDAFIYFNTIGK